MSVRRISALALSVVVITAAVGFACLLLASSAMAMPTGEGMPGCEFPGRSEVACPHAHPVPAAPIGYQSQFQPSAAAAGVVPEGPEGFDSLGLPGRHMQPPRPPVACSTPLRV